MIDQRLFEIIVDSFGKILLPGLTMTIPLTAISFFFALIIALIVAMIQFAHVRVLRQVARFYVWVIRGTPLLVQLFVVFYGMPNIGILIDPFPAAGSRLILEFRGMRHPIPLDRKPRWIRLLHNGDAATEKWHWETSAQLPPSLRKERGVERRVIPADRNPVYISVPESAVPAALLLEIEGITPGNLDEFRHP